MTNHNMHNFRRGGDIETLRSCANVTIGLYIYTVRVVAKKNNFLTYILYMIFRTPLVVQLTQLMVVFHALLLPSTR